VVATNDTTLIATRNLNIEAATETHNETHYSKTKQSGVFSSGGVGFTIGSKQNSTDQKTDATLAARSTVGSTDGNVLLLAGETYKQVGSDVIAAKGDIDIAAKQVDIKEARETSRTVTETKSKQSGFTVAFTSPIITAVQTAQQMSEAAKDTSDPRMKALAAASTGLAGYNAYSALEAGQGITTPDGKTNQVLSGKTNPDGSAEYRDATAADKMGGVGINLSIGGSKSSSTTTQSSDTAAVSNLTAGRDIRIEASGAGEQSDVTLQGAKATAARNLTLTAEDEIRLLAAKNTSDQHSTNKNSSASVGIGFMVGGTQNGFTIQAGVSGGKGKADGQDVSYSNTHVTAGDTLTLQSGGDTTMKGAVAKGEKVVADIGKDLLIESLQDTSTYDSKQKSLGVSVSLCIPPFCVGATGSGSVSASNSKVKSDYASVTEQSAIRAGDKGFDVDVKGDTDLKGGAITSTQQAIDNNKNSFHTGGEFTLSDIQNKAEYKAKSVSASVGAGTSFDGALKPGGTSTGFGKDGDKAESMTLAAISDIAGNTAARTGDKETGIAKIFDQEKVQKEIDAQVKITQMFGQLAPKAAADFAGKQAAELRKQGNEEEAKKWDDGGAYRIALHTALGGMAGGTSGALGAGASAAAAPLLNELQEGIAKGLKDAGANDSVAKLAGQLISGATAAGIGAAAGGTQGAMTAFNADANNRQLHPTEKQRIKELAKDDPQKEARLSAAACALVKCYAEYPEGSAAYTALKAMADAGSSEALAFERQQLQQQQGLFGYSTQGLFSDKNFDAAKQVDNTYQVTTRALGAGQTVLGGLGVAGSVATAPVSCATGIGCVANAVVGTLSADQMLAGAKQVVSGQPENTSLNNALQASGLSSEAASYAELALGVGAAVKAGSVLNAATTTQAANNAAAKLSYEDISKFGAKGVNVSPEVMQTPQAKALIAEYQAAGVSSQLSEDLAKGVLQTGQSLPTVRTAAANEELIKVVPKSAMADDGVSKVSPYFMTRAEYDVLSKLSPAEIGQHLGLPAEQSIRGAQLGFEVYSITPKPGAVPKVFTSTVAPVEQGAYTAVGGAQQTIVPNRSLWTDPNRIGSIGGAK
ncbi:MAG: filamentous hemagglutinin, partial [Pseudomonadota bacterium]|nr:filamentous hemagglutinin [Pseudomonadota bacterium]